MTEKEGAAVSVSAGPSKRHERSGTYEVEEMEAQSGDGSEGKKLKRSSTFDLSLSNDATLPIDEKEVSEDRWSCSLILKRLFLI